MKRGNMAQKVTRSKIEFKSGGATCVGYLYRLNNAKTPTPCIVLGHGFTGVQARLQDVAEHFAAAGFVALTFDYRGFGESDALGGYRQIVSVKDQLQDFREAIAFARAQPDINPEKIALWGSSLGGGHVVTLASEDPRIAAAVAQVPFNGFPKKTSRPRKETTALLGAMFRDVVRGWFGRSPLYIKSVGHPGELAVMSSGEAQTTIDALKTQDAAGLGAWENKVAPRGLLDMILYKPGKNASKIKAPLLVCSAEFDKEVTIDSQEELATGARAELRKYPITHFEVYNPEVRKQFLRDQTAFFETHLLKG